MGSSLVPGAAMGRIFGPLRDRHTVSRWTLTSSSSLKDESSVVTRVLWQVCFTASLALVWSMLLLTYLALVPPRGPRSYPAHLTPGLSFRPRPENTKSTLIHFRHGGSGNWRPLIKRFKSFLKAYAFGKRAGGFQQCNYNTAPLLPGQRCGVPNIKWVDASYDTPCSGQESYGMYHGQPCLIIKLNRIFGWEPEPYYNISQVDSHPTMPAELKTKIRGTWEKNCQGEPTEDRCPQLRMVWLTCEGETAADQEWLGTVNYTPWQGFPGYYFPYHNQDHYLSPIVWIQFRRITPGVVIQIRCRAWARNIRHSARDPLLGGVHIELMMD